MQFVSMVEFNSFQNVAMKVKLEMEKPWIFMSFVLANILKKFKQIKSAYLARKWRSLHKLQHILLIARLLLLLVSMVLRKLQNLS